ncbi:type I-E CRISPR-associated endoribonuclease Cas2 [Saccharopolyspora pogona]|uniref:type I-E CRISPR-associated endoribonuclease Cas2 n=1 Tax=Saccharopolyspora pogona TaxID=333966 RepID=UPI001CC25ECA|nr:type I-E CRISPR-associated endoribonuclease Cas2 [Saccharopolyspora pogona]
MLRGRAVVLVGQAVLVEPANNEQGWTVRTAGRDRWPTVDYDGLILSARLRHWAHEKRSMETVAFAGFGGRRWGGQ